MADQQQAGPLGPDVAVTHILVVTDPARSRDFWVDVLGAELYREYGGTSVVLRFAGAWLLLVSGGRPDCRQAQRGLPAACQRRPGQSRDDAARR
jgi:catechol 2,3-dioxygenase-like lactoylglutathione lyase family enzyme